MDTNQRKPWTIADFIEHGQELVDQDPNCQWSAGYLAAAFEVKERLDALAEAPSMREALADLVEWAAEMGGWEAPCWGRARSVLQSTEPSEACGSCSHPAQTVTEQGPRCHQCAEEGR